MAAQDNVVEMLVCVDTALLSRPNDNQALKVNVQLTTKSGKRYCEPLEVNTSEEHPSIVDWFERDVGIQFIGSFINAQVSVDKTGRLTLYYDSRYSFDCFFADMMTVSGNSSKQKNRLAEVVNDRNKENVESGTENNSNQNAPTKKQIQHDKLILNNDELKRAEHLAATFFGTRRVPSHFRRRDALLVRVHTKARRRWLSRGWEMFRRNMSASERVNTKLFDMLQRKMLRARSHRITRTTFGAWVSCVNRTKAARIALRKCFNSLERRMKQSTVNFWYGETMKANVLMIIQESTPSTPCPPQLRGRSPSTSSGILDAIMKSSPRPVGAQSPANGVQFQNGTPPPPGRSTPNRSSNYHNNGGNRTPNGRSRHNHSFQHGNRTPGPRSTPRRTYNASQGSYTPTGRSTPQRNNATQYGNQTPPVRYGVPPRPVGLSSGTPYQPDHNSYQADIYHFTPSQNSTAASFAANVRVPAAAASPFMQQRGRSRASDPRRRRSRSMNSRLSVESSLNHEFGYYNTQATPEVGPACRFPIPPASPYYLGPSATVNPVYLQPDYSSFQYANQGYPHINNSPQLSQQGNYAPNHVGQDAYANTYHDPAMNLCMAVSPPYLVPVGDNTVKHQGPMPESFSEGGGVSPAIRRVANGISGARPNSAWRNKRAGKPANATILTATPLSSFQYHETPEALTGSAKLDESALEAWRKQAESQMSRPYFEDSQTGKPTPELRERSQASDTREVNHSRASHDSNRTSTPQHFSPTVDDGQVGLHNTLQTKRKSFQDHGKAGSNEMCLPTPSRSTPDRKNQTPTHGDEKQTRDTRQRMSSTRDSYESHCFSGKQSVISSPGTQYTAHSVTPNQQCFQWSNVLEMLCSIGLEQYCDKFVEEDLTELSLLLKLSMEKKSDFIDTMKEMGVSKIGHRERILQALKPYHHHQYTTNGLRSSMEMSLTGGTSSPFAANKIPSEQPNAAGYPGRSWSSSGRQHCQFTEDSTSTTSTGIQSPTTYSLQGTTPNSYKEHTLQGSNAHKIVNSPQLQAQVLVQTRTRRGSAPDYATMISGSGQSRVRSASVHNRQGAFDQVLPPLPLPPPVNSNGPGQGNSPTPGDEHHNNSTDDKMVNLSATAARLAKLAVSQQRAN